MAQNATATVEELEPLFDSAHSALVFAFNFSGQCYDRPMMNRMGAPSLGSGKGLAGLDGAAQAGFVRAEVATLGRLAESILIARIAPRSMPCDCKSSCCAGYKPNREWTNAIAFIADHVRQNVLFGCISNGLMRREYVVRHFQKKESRTSMDALAEKFSVDRNTISAHAAKVSMLLGGVPAKKDRAEVPGLESTAMDAVEERLRMVGMVGNV